MISHSSNAFKPAMTDKSFEINASLSDQLLEATIGKFVKHHRMQQSLTQDELATSAGISRSTLSLLERGETVTVATLIQVLRVLDQLHVLSVFDVKEVISPLALAKLQKAKRRRVRSKTKPTEGSNAGQNEEPTW